ncbi:MAG: methyltransferase domain-containing protein [Terracidiphilus sp.]
MDAVKEHFEQEAREFDRIIVTLIPHYLQMVESLVLAIPFDASAPIRALDLGCGTGTVARHLLERFPNAQLTCLDLAGNMIATAQQKLASYPRVSYVHGDFTAMAGDESYDVVVSSLALHHLAADAEKREFYRRIYLSLRPGGVFYNADAVLGTSDFLQKVYMQQWRAFMCRNISREEVEGKWIPNYEAEDHPAKLTEQLAWLAEAGFTDVDVLWKYYNFAVYGGRKP